MIKPIFTEADIPYDDKEGWDGEKLDDYNSSPARSLYPLLGDGLYHRCSLESCVSILSDGHIKPNRGKFKFTYPQSECNHGYINSWVCLFDFRQDSFRIYIVGDNWVQFLIEFFPITIILKLARRKLPKIIPSSYHDINNKKHRKIVRVPYVEAWYPEPIHISCITDFIVVLPQFNPVKYVAIPSADIFEYPQKNYKNQETLNHAPNARIENLNRNVEEVLQKYIWSQENNIGSGQASKKCFHH